MVLPNFFFWISTFRPSSSTLELPWLVAPGITVAFGTDLFTQNVENDHFSKKKFGVNPC